MGKIYIISDLHFGHENLATHRGFKNAKEQDAFIISNWNRIIKPKDTVWILGDITMEKANYDVLDSLNGYKKVVLGNHDKPQHTKELLKHVNSVCGVFRYRRVLFTHVPIHESEFRYISVNIHGHIHEKIIDDDRYFNVSCEAVNYTPVLLQDILDLPHIKARAEELDRIDAERRIDL